MLSWKYVGVAVDVLLDKTLKAMAASEDAIKCVDGKRTPATIHWGKPSETGDVNEKIRLLDSWRRIIRCGICP